MKALSILALLAVAGPAFAQVPAENQSVPVKDQKPFLYDGLMPLQDQKPYMDHPVTVLSIGGKIITPSPSTEQPPPASPQPSPQSPKAIAG
jgi:hypothetical protein